MISSKDENQQLFSVVNSTRQKLVLLYASLSYMVSEPDFLCVDDSEKRQILISVANCYDEIQSNLSTVLNELSVVHKRPSQP